MLQREPVKYNLLKHSRGFTHAVELFIIEIQLKLCKMRLETLPLITTDDRYGNVPKS